ncbi:MAG: M56 family metallopeptidase [Planctomycetota bacterium]|jgi:beta-lactamase regulating signal transducer with metallopeptidase domain
MNQGSTMVADHIAGFSNTISSVILSWLWQSLLWGTAFAGLTYLLIRLLRLRVGSALEAGLWLIVLVKFLVPVGPSCTFSLSSVYLQLFESSSVHNITLPAPIALDIDNPYLVDVDSLNHGTPSAAMVMPTHSPATEDTKLPRWHWTTPIGAAYVLCVLSLLALRIRSYRALIAHCRLLPGADGQTLNVVLKVCRRLGVRRIPSVKISDENPPFVMRFVSPLLIIPRHLLVRPDELETVIVHEIAHLRRGDVFVRYIQWIAGILFFFWPVVAWISRRLDVAREYACDQWALRQGKLTAPEYARCLLRVVQPMRRPRFAYAPCNMATNPKRIERRIDMILQSKHCTSSRRIWRLLAFAFLLAWACVALTGVAAGPNRAAYDRSRSATEESIHERVAATYNLVYELGGADVNRDGVLSYLEKDTFLVALAMRNAGPFMDEFPYADRNHSGNLDIIEAKDVIRAITLVAYADRRACAATEHVLPLEFCHAALDAQEWLLANASSDPKPSELDQIWSVLCRIQERPTSYAVRMFDHGGPEQLKGRRKYDPDSHPQFHELEGNIGALKRQLATTSDPDRIAKLTLMLTKLETILSKLQE